MPKPLSDMTIEELEAHTKESKRRHSIRMELLKDVQVAMEANNLPVVREKYNTYREKMRLDFEEGY